MIPKIIVDALFLHCVVCGKYGQISNLHHFDNHFKVAYL